MNLNKDAIFDLLTQPTRENFRNFMKTQTGETNEIDFKQSWIGKDKLSKLLIALANSGGGLVIVGVAETDGQFYPVGINEFKKKEIIEKDVRRWIPDSLIYEVHDFKYEGSEYSALAGKRFQILIVGDQPSHLPYISKRDGDDINEGDIYVRRGTQNVKANNIELERILNRRIETQYSSSAVLDLNEHLQQLKVLYSQIDSKIVSSSLLQGLAQQMASMVELATMKDNPYYPSEKYDAFVERMIISKKVRIEQVLDI